MAVLLISRGSFSGGQVISQCLSRMAGIRCLTREDLLAAVNAHRELANKVMASLPSAARDYAQFSALRRPYKILMRLALLEQVRAGNMAYFGYTGHLLLKGIEHVVRVRLIAPVELRIKLMMSRETCSEQEALERIHEYDAERNRWSLFVYGKSLCDPALYDVHINLERFSFPAACCLLQHLAHEREFEATPESLAEVENQYLATRVLAALLDDERTFGLEFGARAQDGQIVLEGPYLEEDDRSLVTGIAGSLPGVTQVRYSEGYAPTFDGE